MLAASAWRTEVWHPLSVHFPIALLLGGTLVTLLSFFIKQHNARPWHVVALAVLGTGCLTAWVAIYTGNLADGIVARKLCDPTVLKDHELAAETAVYLFTAAALVHALTFLKYAKPRVRKILLLLVLFLSLTGSGYLVRASHLGASLVYDQGAGVRDHSTDCSGYE